jgi:mRNA interferase MazF
VAEDLNRGEVRLYRFPKPDKERPVVVLTRSAALRHLTRVTIAPITSTIRDIPTEVRLDEADGMRRPCAVNLDNVVTVPRANLGKRVATLTRDRLAEVCAALDFALGCDEDRSR